MNKTLNLVEMGILKSVVGIKGWFKVKSNTEQIDSLLQFPLWYIGNSRTGYRMFELESGKVVSNGLQVKLAGIDDRTVAERLRGSIIAIPRQAFLPLKENEYYWIDLVGMEVINHHHQMIGVVDYLLETGANDVLVVIGEEKKEILIPFVDVYIESVDMQNKKINVYWELDY